MTIRCPKCRALGLTTDCIRQIGLPVRITEGNDLVDLEVTVRFALTVPTDGADAIDMATHWRERYMERPQLLLADLDMATAEDEYVLAVRPVDVTSD